MIRCEMLFDLEMNCLDAMTRSQLLEAVLKRLECLPADLREGMEAQDTDRLRLLLFAARLIQALRQLRRDDQPAPVGCCR
jgi:hypothetical protein